jgi:DNA-binding SARP family transcriptional activator/class 3 adenylate cyclase
LASFRILGPIDARDGEQQLAVGGPRRLRLFAFLLLHANRSVSTDALTDAVWLARSGSEKRLHMAIARLRKALEPADCDAAPRLRSVGGGYMLTVGRGELDAEVFEAAIGNGRRALEAGDAPRADSLLAGALGLWRGPPLAEVTFEDFAQSEIRRLVELRLDAIQARADARLALGGHEQLVGELGGLLAEQPTHEGLAGRLMVALYRCGRQADALEVYQRARACLAHELGLDPGPALKALQTQILEQAPLLQPPGVADPPAVTEPTPALVEIGAVVSGREHRKTVTVLFVEVVASTAEGGRLDPEALRALTFRCHDVVRAAVGAHGGSVQRLAGGAIVAIFGVPAVHEDDPLRAVRAAVQARGDLIRLADELGVGIKTRTGINTGEAVVGDRAGAEELVVGDLVNVGARLQQGASGGETVIGENVYASVSHAVVAERIELKASGAGESLAAYRLIEIVEGAERRTPQRRSPLVGRTRELQLVTDTYGRTRDEPSFHLLTVLGPAGVGKSRLIEEATARFQDATVVFGRCLSYGDGITFWPLIEVLRAVADIRDTDDGADVERTFAALMSAEEGGQATTEVAGILATLIGAREGVAHVEESFWAVRTLFDALSRQSPLVVVFEDVHWAEPTLLDLIEHLRDMSRDTPLLIVCIARAELLERRPGWGGSGRRETIVHVESLGPGASARLVENLLPGAKLPAEVSERIATSSDGFPLFVEEMIAMLLDEGLIHKDGGAWSADLASVSVPTTIRSLLASRLDSLPDRERRVLELASVIGQEFWREALAAIAPDDISGLGLSALGALARKDLIVPVRSMVIDGDSFRFRHILICDVAYESLPKAERAALHERLAAWLESAFTERLTEVQEIIGYHLAESHGLLSSRGRSRDDLAERAAAHLGAAGRRATGRDDSAAAISLFDRALTLSRSGSSAHRQLLVDAADALAFAGENERSVALLETLMAEASDARDDLLVAYARVGLANIGSFLEPEGAGDRARSEAAATLPIFEAAGDDRGIGAAMCLRTQPDRIASRFAPVAQLMEQARDHFRAAGDSVWVTGALNNLADAVTMGPTPIPDAVAMLDEILADRDANHRTRATVAGCKGLLLALAGHEREAIEAQADGATIIREMRMEYYLGNFAIYAGGLLRCVGQLDEAERLLREADEIRARAGERSNRSTVLALLGEVIFSDERIGEAEQTARHALELSSSDDYWTLAVAHGTLARVSAERGDAAAEPAMRHAVELAEQTDMLWLQGEQWEGLADLLIARGRAEDGTAALRTALERFDQKGATALAQRVRARLGTNKEGRLPDATRNVSDMR